MSTDRVTVVQLPRWVVVCPECGDLGTWVFQDDALRQAHEHAKRYHSPKCPNGPAGTRCVLDVGHTGMCHLELAGPHQVRANGG